MSIRLTLNLDEKVASKLEEQVSSGDITLEDLVNARLAKCQDHNSDKPLYLTDEDRRELEKLLGRNFDTVADFMLFMTRMHLVNVAGAKVPIDQPLLQQLQKSCGARDFKPWITRQVQWMLQHYMGMA